MQLDLLRLSEFGSGDSPEEKLEGLLRFAKIENDGYRKVFNDLLKSNIDFLEEKIANIKDLEAKEAEQARRDAEAATKAEAQRQLEQAVRTNPLIFDSCESKSSSGTWRRSGLICP